MNCLLFNRAGLFYSLLCIILCASLAPSGAQAQEGKGDEVPNPQKLLIPPSPTAASLGKYGEYPVSMSTGTPQITVPLYEIKSTKLSLPLYLSYHGSGIRVNDFASWVGLGFSLQAGGVITRTVRGGVADEVSQFGFLDQAPDIPSPGEIVPKDDYTYLDDLIEGNIDGIPDVFHYNIEGDGGKMFFDKNGDMFTLPYKPIRIEPDLANNTITLTATDGTVYQFGGSAVEKTRINVQGPETPYVSSWYLTSITSADGSDNIRFEYENHGTLFYFAQDQYTQEYRLGPIYEVNLRKSTTKADIIDSQKLKRIIWSGGKVEFNSGFGREDLPTDKKLDEVVIYQRNHTTESYEILRRFTFAYSYFNEGKAGSRLRLDQVQESSATQSKPPYTFAYYGPDLPPIFSTAQDHWGYYNGKTTNRNLIPTIVYDGVEVGYADRSPSAAHMKAATLESINFPTGGKTTFNFEPHTHSAVASNTETVKVTTGTVVVTGVGFDEKACKTSNTLTLNQNKTGTLHFAVDIDVANTPEDDVIHKQFATVVLMDITDNKVILDERSPSRQATYRKEFTVILKKDHQYRFEVCAYGDITQAWPSLYYEEVKTTSGNVTTLAGGLRINSIESYDPVTAQTLVKAYDYNGSNGNTSGRLTARHQYYYTQDVADQTPPPSAENPINCFTYDSYANLIIGESSQYEMPATPITYAYITETQTNTEGLPNGKTLYHYSTYQQPPTQFPFPPPIDQSWQGGLLLEQHQYRYRPAVQQYDTIVKTINEYHTDLRIIKESAGLKAGYATAYPGSACQGPNYFQSRYAYQTAYVFSYWQYLQYSTTTQYGDNGVATVNKTTYIYDNPEHAQLTQTTTTNSEQQPLTTNYQYAQDFTDNTYGSNLLRANHMHSQVLEQTVTVAPRANQSGSGTTTQKITTQYEQVASHVVPKIITNYPTGNTEVQQTEYEYDSYGNITQVLGPDGVPTAYVWGYNYTLPVAQVVGASVAALESKAATEGLQTLDGEALLAELNKLRSLPNVQVTTYTHDPLVGITSVTDPDNRTSTYHYDELNRLQWIESEEGHVVQKFDYQYAQ